MVVPHEPKTHTSHTFILYFLPFFSTSSTTAMASTSSHIPPSDEDKSQDENDIYWPEVITDQIKEEIVSNNQLMSKYYEKQSDLYNKQYKFENLIYDERAWIDNAKEEIQKKEKWIADTKRKIEKKKKKRSGMLDAKNSKSRKSLKILTSVLRPCPIFRTKL